MVRPSPQAISAGLLHLSLVVLVGASRSQAEPVWIEFDSPLVGETVRSAVPVVEIAGRAGQGARYNYDVVVAIDVSESTHFPSGYDADGDGDVGAVSRRGARRGDGSLRLVRLWTTDPDDTIMKASLVTAKALIDRLGENGARVGVITFSGRTRTRAKVGDVTRASLSIGKIRPGVHGTGTNLGKAIRRASTWLRRAQKSDELRDPIIIVLSDGLPTQPAPAIYAKQSAILAAEKARKWGIRIFGLALGPQAGGNNVLRNLAQHTQGGFIALQQPKSVLGIVPAVAGDLVLSDVRVRNLTADRGGRAVRIFPDGTFDALLPVRPGQNQIEIQVALDAGGSATFHRTVDFVLDETERELLRRMRERTLETALGLRAEMPRPRIRRSITVPAD